MIEPDIVEDKPGYTMMQRAVGLLFVTLIVYGAFLGYQSSMHNGKRLDQALVALNDSNQRYGALVLVVDAQATSIARLRAFLLAHGFSRKVIDRTLGPSPQGGGGGATSPVGPAGPAGPPGPSGGGAPNPAPAPSGHSPSPKPDPQPHPSRSPRPQPAPSRSHAPVHQCAVTSPLDGSCALPCPVKKCPLPTITVPPLLGQHSQTQRVTWSLAAVLTGSPTDVLADPARMWLTALLAPWLTDSATPRAVTPPPGGT